MPLGFSYYIFQAISYLVDIYKGKIKPERNILFFSLYMCYFPKFLSGPIERPVHFLEEIKKVYSVNLFESNRLSISFPTILYGAVKFTEYLGYELKSRFVLPDHRGDPAYDSWEIDYQNISESIGR